MVRKNKRKLSPIISYEKSLMHSISYLIYKNPHSHLHTRTHLNRCLLYSMANTVCIFVKFVPISVKSKRSMYEAIFDRNGAKAYVKNPRVFSQRNIRETWFYEIFHSSTASGIQTMHVLGSCGYRG